jgi:hypothetical protein
MADRHPTATRRPPLRLLAALALAAAAGLVAPRAASAGESPSEKHRDKVHKFSFAFFKGWAPIPIETSGKSRRFEDPTVAKYAEQATAKRGVPPSEIECYRLDRAAKAKAPVTTGPAKPAPAPGPASPLDAVVFKSMVDVFNFRLDGFATTAKNYRPSITGTEKGWTEIESKDKVPGRKLEVTRPWGGDKAWFTFAVWEKDGVEYGLAIVSLDSQRDRFDVGFRRVVASFTWHDVKAGEVEEIPELDGLALPAAKKREIETGLVTGWDVLVSPKKNYVVIYNRRGRRNDVLARRIAEQIEAIREQVYESLFPPARKVEAVSIIRVCGDRREYHAYGGPQGSAGYWSDDSEELVFYDADPDDKTPDVNTLAVLYHEAFHQYIYYSVGEVAPHSWFNEGHGDYFAGARYVARQFKIAPFAWRVRLIKQAIAQGPSPYEETPDPEHGGKRTWNRSKGGYSPLKAFVWFLQPEYYDRNIGVNYAQGWSLVYFLREVVPKNAKWNEKWGKILPTYFETLKNEVNRDKAVAAATAPKGGTPGGTPPSSPPSAPPSTPPSAPTTPGNGTPPATPPTPPSPTPPPSAPPAPEAPSTPPASPPATPPEPAMGGGAAPAPPAPVGPGPGAPPPSPPAPEGPTEPPAGPPATPPAAPPAPTPPATPPVPSDPATGGSAPPPAPPPVPPAPDAKPPAGPDAKPPEPGMDGGGAPPETPNPEEAMGIAETRSKYSSSARALRKAVEEAFRGVDFDELEKAWKESILKVPNPR